MTRPRPRARAVIVEARAKLNLGLLVGPRRPDGYHDLITLFQSISLADTLVVKPRSRGFRLVVRSEGAEVRSVPRPKAPRVAVGSRPGDVPAGAANLVLRAARAFASRFELDGGADFLLVKRIPARSGMGGGSADAAATIASLAALYGVRMGVQERTELALGLGSDVPFALHGGTALGTGRGEKLEPVRLEEFRALVAVPRWRISTAEAFDQIDRNKYDLTLWGAKLRSAQLLGRKQLRAGAWIGLGNNFEEVLGRRHPDFVSLRDRLHAAGATHACMTGSGSAVFGIIPPGVSESRVAGRFVGSERLHVVRSKKAGLRLLRQP